MNISLAKEIFKVKNTQKIKTGLYLKITICVYTVANRMVEYNDIRLNKLIITIGKKDFIGNSGRTFAI